MLDKLIIVNVYTTANQSIFIRQCNFTRKQTKKCDRLPEQTIAQQSWLH